MKQRCIHTYICTGGRKQTACSERICLVLCGEKREEREREREREREICTENAVEGEGKLETVSVFSRD